MSDQAREDEILTLAQRVAQTIGDLPSGPKAFTELVGLAYEQLRIVGRGFYRREGRQTTLQPTAILHEAYLRLQTTNPLINDGAHFYRLVAQTMRRILIDHAKARHRHKREAPSQEEFETLIAGPYRGAESVDIVDIDIALRELETHSPQAADVAQLHYFFELQNCEIAEVLRTSEATVDRTLRFVKSWVQRYIKVNVHGSEHPTKSQSRRP